MRECTGGDGIGVTEVSGVWMHGERLGSAGQGRTSACVRGVHARTKLVGARGGRKGGTGLRVCRGAGTKTPTFSTLIFPKQHRPSSPNPNQKTGLFAEAQTTNPRTKN